MYITLSPQIREGSLKASVERDILTINGVSYDFTPLLEGSFLSANAIDCVYIIDKVTRENGVISLTLLLPIKFDAPDGASFPQPINAIQDGVINFPEGTNVD